MGFSLVVPPEAEGATRYKIEVLEFLDNIHVATGWTILATPQVQGEMVVWLNDASLEDALRVLEFNGYHYDIQDNTMIVRMFDEKYQQLYGGIKFKEFEIHHANVEQLTSILEVFLSPAGKLLTVPRTARLMVLDTEENLEYVERVINSLDVDVQPLVLEVQFVPLDTLVDQITPILSSAGEAWTHSDSNSIIVIDAPDRLGKVEKLIAMLDVAPVTHTFQLNYALPDEVAAKLTELLPNDSSRVQWDVRTEVLTLTAPPAIIDFAVEQVALWDEPHQQVHIEGVILTVNASRLKEIGVDWRQVGRLVDGKPFVFENSGDPFLGIGIAPQQQLTGTTGRRQTTGRATGQNTRNTGRTGTNRTNTGFRQTAGTIAGLDTLGTALSGLTTTTGGSRLNTRVLEPTDFSAIIRLIASDDDTEILQRPSVVVLDGQEARFEEVTDEPFQEGSVTTGLNLSNAGRLIPLRVIFKQVGTILIVTPRVNKENRIEMLISVEDSTAIQRTIISSGQETTVPVVTRRTAQTVIMIESGETVAIGGLIRKRDTENIQKIPFLGDLPFIGNVFRSMRRSVDARELLIFMTPTIIGAHLPLGADRIAQSRQNLDNAIDAADRKHVRDWVDERWGEERIKKSSIFSPLRPEPAETTSEEETKDLTD